MGIRVEFNKEFEFVPLNAEGLDLDFSYNQFSPNPNLVKQFVMELVCSPSQDPIQYAKDWIAKYSILNNIPTDIKTDDDFIFSGQTKLGSTQSAYIQGQGQNTQFNLLFEPNSAAPVGTPLGSTMEVTPVHHPPHIKESRQAWA